MSTITPAARVEDRFIEAFRRMEGHTLNGQSAHVHNLRKQGIERFEALGLPGKKDEAWKYTNVRRALRDELRLGADAGEATAADVDARLIPGLDAHVAVLVDGRFRADLSRLDDLPEGLVVTGLAHAAEAHADVVDAHLGRYAPADTDAFTALNTAFLQDGLFVHVAPKVQTETPVVVVHIVTADDLFVQPRLLVVAETGSLARVIELHEGGDVSSFTNSVAEMWVAPNADLRHFKVQDEGARAAQIATLQVYQTRDSRFSTHTTTLSGAFVRNQQRFLPDAENCETHLMGFYLGRGSMHVDNRTLVDHAQPGCFSNELFKGILDDDATGVFNGKVLVRQDAQQTNAYQSSKSILLSEGARIYAKPELEIYADDVKCSHGATTGQLDPDALFYLRARGLSERQARSMLLLAFARDVIDEIRYAPLREHLDAVVASRLEA